MVSKHKENIIRLIKGEEKPLVIKKTKELAMVSMPGVMTPTEIRSAHKWGADFVKLFPAVNMGPDYIKAVKAPLSDIKYLNYDLC